MKALRLIFAVFLIGLPAVSLAKRGTPKAVPPVFTPTLRVVAPLDDGRVARIQAYDRSDGRLLWTLVVFENKIKPGLEEDVQWRFIQSMKVTGEALEIVAEGGARYRVNLATRKAEL